MKKLLFLMVIVFGLIFLPCKTHAMSTIATNDDSGNATLESNEVIDDNLAVFGNSVSIRGTVNGDLFVAGSIVKIEGEVKGNVFAGANMVNISGKVHGDTFIGGNSVTINENALLGRDVFIGGNIVDINGLIERNLFVGTNQFMLNNIVKGNVNAGIADLKLGENAKILGKLKYSNQHEIKIPNQSAIQGGIEFNQINSNNKAKVNALNISNWFIGLLQLLFVGLILVAIMPKWISSLSSNIKNKFWSTLGIGFLIILIVPPALILLLISFVGLPASFVLLGIYVILIYIVKFWVAYCIGSAIKPQWSGYVKMLIGILIIQILFAIPFIGFLTRSVVLLAGLGSLYLFKPFKNAK